MKYISSKEYRRLYYQVQRLIIKHGAHPFCALHSKQTLTSNWKLVFVSGALVYFAPGYNRIYKLGILNQFNAFLFFILYRLGLDITKIYRNKNVFLVASLSSMNQTPREINRILDRNPKIILIQHGGGFEERITPRNVDLQMIEQGTDGFLSWQYGAVNIAQTRFFISHPLFYINRFKSKIRIVCYGGFALKRNILPFVECMERNKIKVTVHLHPNPDLSMSKDSLSCLEGLKIEVEKGLPHSVIRHNDIIILDGPFHTLAYYLNYVKYQPLILWSDSYDSALSKNAKKYYNNLREDGYIIDINKESCSKVCARIKDIYKASGKITRINKAHDNVFLYNYIKDLSKK